MFIFSLSYLVYFIKTLDINSNPIDELYHLELVITNRKRTKFGIAVAVGAALCYARQVENGGGNMEHLLYVMLLEKTKTYKRMNKAAVVRHVDNIRGLDDEGKIELCGVLRKCPGFAGMVILKAESYEEADELCKREPLVIEGYVTYKLMSLQVGNRENNYLL